MPKRAIGPVVGRGLTEELQEARARTLLRQVLDQFDVGRLRADPWTQLQLGLALTAYGWRLYPLVTVYVARARLSEEQRPQSRVSLPPRWAEQLDEMRSEFSFPAPACQARLPH
ncbi:hypothetical protein STAQ_10240 [Allostella sp. ATCC 35155]|nr:hypothetical protein STAQ_10240 [Stella sp. ATCC 35155]